MTTPSDPFGDPNAPQPGYGAPEPGYGAPPPGYGAAPIDPFSSPGGPQLVGWGTRVGSALIDGAPFIAAAFLGLASDALGLLLNLAALAFFFWNLYQQGVTGQTVGKKVMGTSLRREADGQFVGGGLSIARGFVHVVDALPCYVGYLWPRWDAKKQTFADKILKTVVVKA